MKSISVGTLRSYLYPTTESRDPVHLFLQFLESYLSASMRVLDVGAGAGRNAYNLKGRCREIVGVDMDPRVVKNPLLNLGVVSDGETLPFPDASFDLAFSIYVLEHVQRPAVFTQELHRVLRPGGYYLALTPNFLHYVSLLSRLTPLAFHRWVNAKRGRPPQDTYPTFYRMNRVGTQKRQFESAGFEVSEIKTLEVEPHYLEFSVPSYLLGVGYERIVNSSHFLSPFRVNILSAFQKKQGQPR